MVTANRKLIEMCRSGQRDNVGPEILLDEATSVKNKVSKGRHRRESVRRQLIHLDETLSLERILTCDPSAILHAHEVFIESLSSSGLCAIKFQTILSFRQHS